MHCPSYTYSIQVLSTMLVAVIPEYPTRDARGSNAKLTLFLQVDNLLALAWVPQALLLRNNGVAGQAKCSLAEILLAKLDHS